MTSWLLRKRTFAGAAGAFLLLSGGSCQRHGVCDDVAGSCLALRVEGDGPFESLRTTLHIIGDASSQRQGDTLPGSGETQIDLPLTLRVVPPLEVRASEVGAVEVSGIKNGQPAARAKSGDDFSWPDGSHISLTLRLTSPDAQTDGGVTEYDMTTPPPTDLKWRAETNPGRASLYGVWAGSGTQAYTVGDNGTILARQGDGTWKAESAGGMGTLNGVNGILGGNVFIVGETPGSWRRDTMRWNQDSTGLNLGRSQLLTLTSCGPGDLWAGDENGRVYHRTGPANANGTWQTPEQVFGTFDKVFGVSCAGGAIFAVGDNGRAAVRKDGNAGTRWQTFQYPALPMGGPFTLDAVWAFDKDNAVAVGSSGLLVRYSSGAWQMTPQSITTQGTEFFGVWGPRPDRVFAVGGGGLIVRVDGAKATELARNTAQTLYAIYGISETDIYVVGSTNLGASLILHGTP
jgi:hypothetical protein